MDQGVVGGGGERIGGGGGKTRLELIKVYITKQQNR
jgi:hypothetical protein